MQAATALPIAAGAILFASITFNAANPKRSKSSSGFPSSAGASRQSIDYNRSIKFSSPEYGGSLSSMRRSTEFASPEFGGSLSAARRAPPKTSSRHSRTQSLNRNIPHTPSATVSMSETLHSRNTSTSGIRRTTGQPTGRGTCEIPPHPFLIALMLILSFLSY